MNMFVKIYRRLFSVVDNNKLYESSFSDVLDFTTIKYSTGYLVLNISVNKIKYYGGISFSNQQHHFLKYYIGGIKSLKEFYESHQPKNVFEQHYIDDVDNDAKTLPWLDDQQADRDIIEHGLSMIDHGHQAFGPVSVSKLNLEAQRLKNILRSLEKQGYDSEHGYPRGYFLINHLGDWVFHVVGGKHRVAALVKMGWQNIPFQLEPSFPRIIYQDKISEWPGVTKGIFSKEEADQIFCTYFRSGEIKLTMS